LIITTFTPNSNNFKLMYNTEKKLSSSPIMLHRYAKSGDRVLPPASAKRHKANHRKIE